MERQRRERHELVVTMLLDTNGCIEDTARRLGMHRNSVRNVIAQLPSGIVRAAAGKRRGVTG